jgi:hypothetical protein
VKPTPRFHGPKAIAQHKGGKRTGHVDDGDTHSDPGQPGPIYGQRGDPDHRRASRQDFSIVGLHVVTEHRSGHQQQQGSAQHIARDVLSEHEEEKAHRQMKHEDIEMGDDL